MKIKGFRRDIVLICLLCLTVFYCLFTIFKGNAEDRVLRRDNEVFNTISSDINQGDFVTANSKSTSLLQKYPNNYLLNWLLAASLLNRGYYADANQSFEAARRIRPFLVTDPQFVTQYGQSLYYGGDYKNALRYLERAQKLSPEQASALDPIVKDTRLKLNLK